jgi:hypothetical protein
MDSRLRILGWWAGLAAVLYVVVWFGAAHLPRNAWYGVPASAFDGPSFLEGWYRYDGGWYDFIARDGYQYRGEGVQSEVAFFPAYPVLMWLLAPVLGGTQTAGIAITLAAGAIAVLLFHRWTADRLGEAMAWSVLPILLLFPYAWYLFGAVYGDAVFLAAALGAFLALERDRPVLAGLLGIVATAGRPVGVAVVIGLVVLLLERRNRLPDPRRGDPFRPADAGVLLSLGGLGGWMAYQWVRWGDPLLFVEVQEAWGQEPGPRTWFKVTFLRKVHQLPGWLADALAGEGTAETRPWNNAVYAAGLLLQALLVLAAILLLWQVGKRFGWGYLAYSAAVIGIPFIGSADFQGLGRYLLAAFPVLAVAGVLLAERPRLRLVWLSTSAALLLVLTTFYARAFYVA